MKKLMLAAAALMVAGSARATVPDWMRDSDAANIVAKAKKQAAQMKADATTVAPPQGLIQISAGESGHLLELARRVVERGDVTLTGKTGQSDKYDAYACENIGTGQIAAVAKAPTCARVFHSSATVLIVALEVVADVNGDGTRSIKGVKIFPGCTSCSTSASKSLGVNLFPDAGIWLPGGRSIQYANAQQLTSDEQQRISEEIDVWERMTTGMMSLDDSCYYADGGTCG